MTSMAQSKVVGINLIAVGSATRNSWFVPCKTFRTASDSEELHLDLPLGVGAAERYASSRRFAETNLSMWEWLLVRMSTGSNTC